MTPALANYDCLTGLWNPDTPGALHDDEQNGRNLLWQCLREGDLHQRRGLGNRA